MGAHDLVQTAPLFLDPLAQARGFFVFLLVRVGRVMFEIRAEEWRLK